MYHHAIRITLPYADCSDVISKWSDRCARVIVYQHDADEEISKTHVHLGLYDCEVKAEQLKRMWADAPGKGNEFWSWKDATQDPTKYLTYMSKGSLRPKYVKNFSNELVETSRIAWVEPVNADKPGDATEHYITEVLKKYERYNSIAQYTEYNQTDGESTQWELERLLNDIRSTTMKLFYHKTQRSPPATLYKSVAGSAFLRISDKWNVLDTGISTLRNLWY